MSGRDITAVIGPKTYYEQVGNKKSFSDGGQAVDAYLVKITEAVADQEHKGKYALIKSRKQDDGQYITDITYGGCDLLGKINTANNVNLSTRTFDGTRSVEDSREAGAKKPEETTANKEWVLSANQADWKALGASVPADVTAACTDPAAGGAPAAAGSAPAVSKPALGEVNAAANDAKVDIKFDKPIVAANADESISVKVNGRDKSLAKGAYTIAGDTLSINKTGIDALGIANTTADNKLIVNADQIADKADPTKKNVITGELVLQAKAPGSTAPDAHPGAHITTPPDSTFPQSGPIELIFENNLQVANNINLDATRIAVVELDSSGNEVPATEQKSLTYEVVDSKKLKISQPSGSQFKPATKYKILIQPGTFLDDDGSKANTDHIVYTFKAVTKLIKKKN